MELVRAGMILAAMALSIPFVIHRVIEKIERETSEGPDFDHLVWSVTPHVWKEYRTERNLFRQYSPFWFFYAWVVIHTVVLVVTAAVAITGLIELYDYLGIGAVASDYAA